MREIKQDSEALKALAQKTMREIKKDGINVGDDPMVILNIVSTFLQTTIEELAVAKQIDADVEINLFSILSLGVSHSVFENDENIGNFVPTAVPDVAFKMVVKSDELTAELMNGI